MPLLALATTEGDLGEQARGPQKVVIDKSEMIELLEDHNLLWKEESADIEEMAASVLEFCWNLL
jgi:hypothetical protein